MDKKYFMFYLIDNEKKVFVKNGNDIVVVGATSEREAYEWFLLEIKGWYLVSKISDEEYENLQQAKAKEICYGERNLGWSEYDTEICSIFQNRMTPWCWAVKTKDNSIKNEDIYCFIHRLLIILRDEKEIPRTYECRTEKENYTIEVDYIFYDNEIENFELVVYADDSIKFIINLEHGFVVEYDGDDDPHMIKTCSNLVSDNHSLYRVAQTVISIATEIYNNKRR